MAGLTLQPGEKDPRKVADVVRQLTEGRSNATGTFTLAVSPATTTAVANPNCAPGSIIQFGMPQTANAAAAFATTFIAPANVTQGQFIVTHAASAQVDRTFGYEVRG